LGMYRTIVIDPAARTVDEVESEGHRDATARLVAADHLDYFRLAEHPRSWDYGYCDERGLARQRPIHAFLFSIRPDPIAGRCALHGVKKDTGSICDCTFPLDVIRWEITWLGLVLPRVEWIDTPNGSVAVVSYTALQ